MSDSALTSAEKQFLTLDDFKKKENILKILSEYEKNRSMPLFFISSVAFDGVSPSFVVHTLCNFTLVFTNLEQLHFTKSTSKTIINYFKYILEDFVCVTLTSSYYFIRPKRAYYDADTIDMAWDKLQESILACERCREQKKIQKQAIVIEVSAKSLEEMRQNDDLVLYATFLANPTAEFKEKFESDSWACMYYALENDLLEEYLKDHTLNLAKYVKYFGFVTEMTMNMLFQALPEEAVNDFTGDVAQRVSQKLVNNLMYTWTNACMGIFLSENERIYGARPDVVIPKTRPKNVGDWMMNYLDSRLEIIVSGSVLKALEDSHNGLISYFHDWARIQKLMGSTLNLVSRIIPYVSREDVCEALTESYLHKALASIFIEMAENDEEGFTGLETIYENLSDRFIETVVFNNNIRLCIQRAIMRHLLYLEYTKTPLCQQTPIQTKTSIESKCLQVFSRRILRQTVEYNRCTLAAAFDITDLPFIVQGESFCFPMSSWQNVSVARVIRTEMYFTILGTINPDPLTHVALQLPSQLCYFNKSDELQHDYLVCQPRWNDSRTGIPDVYSAILNTSSCDMTFKYTASGRAVSFSANRKRTFESMNYRSSEDEDEEDEDEEEEDNQNDNTLQEKATTKDRIMMKTNKDTFVLPSGEALIYRRNASVDKDNVLHTHQCRLSHCLKQNNTGVCYLQFSVAVYRKNDINEYHMNEIKETLLAMSVGGVVKNWLYTGRQEYERGKEKNKNPTRRQMFPSLYSQLTNAMKKNTQTRFYENWAFLQRPQILSHFYQNVLICVDDIRKESRLVVPKVGGQTYNHRVGYQIEYQRLDFQSILRRLSDITKLTVNCSVGVTQSYVNELYSTSERQTISRIYSNCPPPCRNLQGLLLSNSDSYAVSKRSPSWELNFFGARLFAKCNN